MYLPILTVTAMYICVVIARWVWLCLRRWSILTCWSPASGTTSIRTLPGENDSLFPRPVKRETVRNTEPENSDTGSPPFSNNLFAIDRTSCLLYNYKYWYSKVRHQYWMLFSRQLNKSNFSWLPKKRLCSCDLNKAHVMAYLAQSVHFFFVHKQTNVIIDRAIILPLTAHAHIMGNLNNSV